MKADPHCHWCRRPLFYSPVVRGLPMPEDFPTLDHLNDKIFVKKRPILNGVETIVLSCPPCNWGRASVRQLKYYVISMWKAGAFPSPFRWVGTTLKFVRKQRRTPKL